MLAQLAAGPGPLNEAQKGAAAAQIATAMSGLSSLYMSFPLGNDDMIDHPKRLKIEPGEKPTLHFISPSSQEDAHYDIRFKIV